METTNVSFRPQALGIIAAVLGILGIAFYWYVPMGMVLSLTGLILGFVGWALAPRRGHHGLVIAGLVIAIAALVLDFVVVGLGLETFTFTALR